MEKLAATIKKLTGVNIEPEKYYLFDHRFADVLNEFKLESLDRLLAELQTKNDAKLVSRVIEKITTHETRFFRDESIFDALVEQIIPEWKDRNVMAGTGGLQYPPLKIWSAACSTGQEVYSIAIMLSEFHANLSSKIQILATDIAEESVEKAKAGTYTDFELSRGMPEKFRSKFFESAGGKGTVRQNLLPSMTFRAMNLLSDPQPEKFDIIFCRNVAYYFAQDARKQLFEKMRASLKRDGILVLGSAESLNGILTDYVLREFGLARYYELNTENVTIFARKKPAQ
jgi:chemotaxis protein methyltransferase CheR